MNLKKILPIMMMSLASALCFARTGYMAGAKNIKIVSTKHFDIIYPEECIRSANELYEKAESIYEDLAKEFNYDLTFTLPVVIIPGQDVFNAHFTILPYNHIVLYDTCMDEDFVNFKETFINVFAHELTHAVSFNIKSTFWSGASALFGDICNPGSIIAMPQLIHEGATVSYESKNGEGRLNQGYYMHTVRQAKLMDAFPTVYSATGARDIKPTGMGYSFGGPFAEYLKERFGKEKYAEFWYRGINGWPKTYRKSFKKVYGIKITDAWKDFIDTIKIPDIDKEPLNHDGVKLFHERKGQLYGNLASCKNALAFISKSSASAYYCRKGENGFSKPKKLFSQTGLSRISMSPDGKFIAASYINKNHINMKNMVSIYSIEDKRWFNLDETGLRDPCIVKKDDDYYLLAVKTSSEYITIKSYRLFLDRKSRIKSAEEISSKTFGYGHLELDLTSTSDGRIFSLSYDGLSPSITEYDFDGTNLSIKENHQLPENARYKSLSCMEEDGKLSLSFSYCTKDSFPRYGILTIEAGGKKTLELMDEDISGGVLSPILSEDKIIFISDLYEHEKLLSLERKSISHSNSEENCESNSEEKLMAENENEESEIPNGNTEENEGTEDFSKLIENSRPYRRIYWKKGSIFPFCISEEYTIKLDYSEDNLDGIRQTSSVANYFGLTWFTTVPWESAGIYVSGGYNPIDERGAFTLIFNDASPTPKYNFQNSSTVIFDSEGFRQCTNNFTLDYQINFRHYGSLAFSDKNILIYGKTYEDDKDKTESENKLLEDKNKYLYDKNIASVTVSNIHKTGNGLYESFGIEAGISYKNIELRQCGEEKTNSIFKTQAKFKDLDYEFLQKLYPTLRIDLPCLIPIDCARGFTYNLPVSFYGELGSSYDEFYIMQAEAVIFGCEIQKGVGWMCNHFNRFALSAGYQRARYSDRCYFDLVNIKDFMDDFENLKLSDAYYLKFLLDQTINTGALFSYSVGLNLYYRPNHTQEQNDFQGKASLFFMGRKLL